MAVLEDWLFNKMGISANLNEMSDTNIFKDGSVIFTILQKHGLLDANFVINITSSSDNEVCLQNLKKFQPLFDVLKVDYDDNVMLNIVNGNKSVIFKLLYEMYVCLENKKHLYFIATQDNDKHNFITCSDQDKYNIKTPNKSGDNLETDKHEQLENTLFENRDILEWYQNKCNIIKHDMTFKVTKLKKQVLREVNLTKPKNKPRCCCIDDASVKQLPNLEECTIDNIDHDKLLSYKEFVASYKEKQLENKSKQSWERDMQQSLLEESWKKVKKKQQETCNSIFSEILLKQSNYEKQIVTKLIQTEQQVKFQNEFKIKFNTDIFSEEEVQINTDMNGEKLKNIEQLYLEEKKRVQGLLNKLDKENQIVVNTTNSSVCHDIISELIDIAALASEYKEQYNSSVPKRLLDDWKQLFIKGQSIHIPFQQLNCLDDNDIDYESIIHLEKLNDDVLNENDIDQYLLTQGKWYCKDICLYNNDINKNYLAYIVSRLLSIKYTPLPRTLPAALPTFKVAGVLININNVEIIEKLNNILSKHRIHVFDPQTAINKSVDQYIKETAMHNNEDVPLKKKQKLKNKSERSNKSERGKEVKNKKKNKSKVKPVTKKTDDETEGISDDKIINIFDKETQTSVISMHVDERPQPTSLARIGETVLNTLKNGEIINDDLMISVIIEYLKSLEGIAGWVLVNFPLNLKQACIFEVALSGKYLPIEKYTTQEIKTDQNTVANDQKANITSRILILPELNSDDPFKSYFSTFIKAKQQLTDQNEDKAQQYNIDNLSNDGENKNGRKGNEEPLDMLEIFYKDLSIFKEFHFEQNNLNTLKNLAELILKTDENSALKSNEIKVNTDKQTPSKDETNFKMSKRTLSNLRSPKSTKHKKGKKAQSPRTLSVEKRNTIIKESISVKEDTDEMLTDQPFRTKIKFIDNGEWEFISLPIDDELANILATIWENIEKQYLSNLSDIFFENRILNSRLVPYSKYVKEEVESIREKPDMRQNLINTFQDNYNKIVYDLRTVTGVKNQLHCEVLQLQQNLWKITDEIKNETESKRQNIIKENWLVDEICLLINNYLSLVQTEFDKSLETLKFMNYYYLSMLDKNITATANMQHENFIVPRLNTEMFLKLSYETDHLHANEKGSFSTSDDTVNHESQESQINCFSRSLIDCKESEIIVAILKKCVIDVSSLAKNRFQSSMNYFLNQIYNNENSSILSPKKTRKEKFNDSKSKKTESKENKEKSLTRENSIKGATNLELLMKEWKLALDAERDNLTFQLDLIETRAVEDILEFYCYLRTLFCDLYHSNLERYNEEISNIHKICEFFRTAIEEESAIQDTLVFARDKFFMRTCQNFVNRKKYKLNSLVEDLHDCYFSIHQIKNLKDIFKIAAPNGVIRKQAFCYIFKDLALSNDKDNLPHLPKMWSKLDNTQLTAVLDLLLGPGLGVDWRDFLICNLNISFPSIGEVLTLRNIFLSYDLEETETVSKEVYEKVTLWFEVDLPSSPQESLRLMLVKQLLFELFQVKETYINYTALLLYFCKDFDPKSGLRKALSLSIGKNVITIKEELDEILKEENEIIKIVTDLLLNIVNTIVQEREGVLIFEIEDETEFSLREEKSNSVASLQSETKVISDKESSKQSSAISINGQETHKQPTLNNSVLFTKQFESEKQWVSEIPITAVESVLNASLYFTHITTKRYVDALKELADKEDLIEGYILMSSSCIQKLLLTTKKFLISLPCEIIQNVLKVKK